MAELGFEPRQAGGGTFALKHYALSLKEAKIMDSGASVLGIPIPQLPPISSIMGACDFLHLLSLSVMGLRALWPKGFFVKIK